MVSSKPMPVKVNYHLDYRVLLYFTFAVVQFAQQSFILGNSVQSAKLMICKKIYLEALNTKLRYQVHILLHKIHSTL